MCGDVTSTVATDLVIENDRPPDAGLPHPPPFTPFRPHPLLLSCTLIHLKMMSNKRQVVHSLQSHETENALRESIAGNPERIVRYSRMRSMPYSTENMQKIGGRRWKFFAKSAGRCFTPLIEINHNSVSLRWNFYTYIQLIRGRFWLQLGRLKGSVSHASRENTLLRCGKIQKWLQRLQRHGRGILAHARPTQTVWVARGSVGACLFIACL